MKKYKNFFDFYGKKLHTTIEARNVNDAKEFVKNKIIFYKIKDVTEDDVIEKLSKKFNFK